MSCRVHICLSQLVDEMCLAGCAFATTDHITLSTDLGRNIGHGSGHHGLYAILSSDLLFSNFVLADHWVHDLSLEGYVQVRGRRALLRVGVPFPSSARSFIIMAHRAICAGMVGCVCQHAALFGDRRRCVSAGSCGPV
jgi:hypothetical protein